MRAYIKLEIIYQRFDLFLQDNPIDTLNGRDQIYDLFKQWYCDNFPGLDFPCKALLMEYLIEQGMDPTFVRSTVWYVIV